MLDHENGTESPTRTHVNSDSVQSIDMGCMQVNDYWHFGHDGWTVKSQIFNPAFNVQLAYKIYLGRKAASGNGWQAWYSVKGLLW